MQEKGPLGGKEESDFMERGYCNLVFPALNRESEKRRSGGCRKTVLSQGVPVVLVKGVCTEKKPYTTWK